MPIYVDSRTRINTTETTWGTGNMVNNDTRTTATSASSNRNNSNANNANTPASGPRTGDEAPVALFATVILVGALAYATRKRR